MKKISMHLIRNLWVGAAATNREERAEDKNLRVAHIELGKR